jgi:regulator of protease activity HflC (stomatin/prohibitin superfamily)
MTTVSPPTVLLVILVVFALIVLAKSIKVVPQKQVKLIERLGRFRKRADAGLNVIVPFFDSVRATIDLREQITQIEPQPVITRDNVTMKVDAVIYFVVADPVRATYEVQNLTWGIEQLTLSGLRNVIGALDLDHTLTSRDTINTQLRSALDQATQQWGVKIMRVELKNIDPPQDIKLTMEKQMTAERTRRAMVTNAEGEKSSAILKAEGQKQSQIVSAEGEKQSRILEAEGQAQARLRVAEAEAQAIKVVAEAIGAAGNPAQYLIAQRYLEAFAQLGANADRIVYLPWEASGVLASLGGIRDIVSGAGTPEGASPTPHGPSAPQGPRPAPPIR